MVVCVWAFGDASEQQSEKSRTFLFAVSQTRMIMNNKALVILLIIAVTMTTSCSNRKVNEVELYGNTFICIMDFDDYDVPDDWKEYDSSKQSVFDGETMYLCVY